MHEKEKIDKSNIKSYNINLKNYENFLKKSEYEKEAKATDGNLGQEVSIYDVKTRIGMDCSLARVGFLIDNNICCKYSNTVELTVKLIIKDFKQYFSKNVNKINNNGTGLSCNPVQLYLMIYNEKSSSEIKHYSLEKENEFLN